MLVGQGNLDGAMADMLGVAGQEVAVVFARVWAEPEVS